MIKEKQFNSNKGLSTGDCIIYSKNKRIIFDKVANVIDHNLLKTCHSDIIDERDIQVLAYSGTIESLLETIERIELAMNDNIHSFHTKGSQRKSEIAFYLKNNDVIIVSVKFKDK